MVASPLNLCFLVFEAGSILLMAMVGKFTDIWSFFFAGGNNRNHRSSHEIWRFPVKFSIQFVGFPLPCVMKPEGKSHNIPWNTTTKSPFSYGFFHRYVHFSMVFLWFFHSYVNCHLLDPDSVNLQAPLSGALRSDALHGSNVRRHGHGARQTGARFRHMPFRMVASPTQQAAKNRRSWENPSSGCFCSWLRVLFWGLFF